MAEPRVANIRQTLGQSSRIDRMYYSHPDTEDYSVTGNFNAAEYDSMLDARAHTPERQYAVYREILDEGDVYDVMRVMGETNGGQAIVNSITYGSRSPLGSANERRDKSDLVFFKTREAAQRYLRRRIREQGEQLSTKELSGRLYGRGR